MFDYETLKLIWWVLIGVLVIGMIVGGYTLLRGAGVDMASPKPIEDATKLFDEMISEMEKILN
mgnify:CR=1 FL=1